MKQFFLVFSIIVSSAVVNAETIASCSGVKGYSFYQNLGSFSDKKSSGWDEDQITEGKTSVIRNDDGFDILFVDGHTEKQMLPVIKYKNETIVFAGDLIPTVGHLPIPYIMSYDTKPLISLEEKASFLDLAEKNNYLLFMEHDPNNELISLKKTEKGVRLDDSFTLKTYF